MFSTTKHSNSNHICVGVVWNASQGKIIQLIMQISAQSRELIVWPGKHSHGTTEPTSHSDNCLSGNCSFLYQLQNSGTCLFTSTLVWGPHLHLTPNLGRVWNSSTNLSRDRRIGIGRRGAQRGFPADTHIFRRYGCFQKVPVKNHDYSNVNVLGGRGKS